MPKRRLRHLIAAALWLLLAGSAGLAQTADQRVRLAQNMERAGRYEDAARLYEELYAMDSTNVVYFDGLRRMYVQLKRDDDAIDLISRRLAVSPGDLALRAQLGNVLYRSGREADAYVEWAGIIRADSVNPAVYRVVAGAMMENRLIDRTTDLYRRARRATGKPELFRLEMAQLFSATMNYREAAAEYAHWLSLNPGQISFIQQRMASLSAKEEGRREAINELNAMRQAGPVLPHLELLAWLYLEGKEYHEAHDVVREIDRISGAGGARIYAFAEQAFREKSWQAAAEAYREAIGIPVDRSRLPGSLYGYAACLIELGTEADSLSGWGAEGEDRRGFYAEGIDRFHELIEAYPRTEYSARAHFRIGLIHLDRFFEPSKALRSFLSVEAELPQETIVSYAVSLKIGEVLTAQGDTSAASARFLKVLNASGALPDQQDEASFRLAELSYFRGDFAPADSILAELTLNLGVDYANDALKLQAFLLENRQNSEAALRDFAEADYLGRIRRDDEAISRLEGLVERYPKALLIDDAFLLAADLRVRNGAYQEAILTLRRLLDDAAGSGIERDEAWFRIGEIYHYRLKDGAAASAAYQSLLAEFPGSLRAEEARRRIRQLRGDTL